MPFFFGLGLSGWARRQFLFGGHVGPGLAPMLPYLAVPTFEAGELLEIGFLFIGGPGRRAGHDFVAVLGEFGNEILAQHFIEFFGELRGQKKGQPGLAQGFLGDAHL